jgi:hypothetical protein
MPDFPEVQAAYVEELRSVMPDVLAWWQGLFGGADPGSEEARPVHKRWPTGPAGHPRLLAIFRKYYLEIEEINDANRVEFEAKGEPEIDKEELWANTVEDEVLRLQKPQDLLIHDLQHIDAALFDVMQGVVFVPIGLNRLKEAV